MKADKSLIKTFVFIIISLLVSLAFVLFLSPCTSWVYGDLATLDDSVFFTVGKYWFKDGTLPYVGLWDMKGPIIHFINGIGYSINGNLHGLIPIQTLCVGITILCIYHLYKDSFSKYVSVFLSLILIWGLSYNYDGGNCVEEYILPLLMVSYYFLYKWLSDVNKGMFEHNPLYAGGYGGVLGFSLLTRLTNALGVMGAVAFICVILIWQKKWKNLGYNALCFIIGFCVITLPFILYFWYHDALCEMWYGTILYNMEYAKTSSTSSPLWRVLIVYPYGVMFAVYSLILLLGKGKKLEGLLWLSSSILALLWLAKSFTYAHYGIILYPTLPILFLHIYKNVKYLQDYKYVYVLIVTLFCISVFGIRLQRTIAYSKETAKPDACQKIIDLIPSEEKNSVVLYNCQPSLYYYNEIKPDNRFFALQDFEAQVGGSLYDRIFESFSLSETKWILFCGNQKSIIYPILKQKYFEFGSDGNCTLYKHK